MSTPFKLYRLVFTYLFLSALVLTSQNKNSSRYFSSSKDIFGTRLFVENKKQFDKAIKTNDKIYYALENGQERIYFTNKGLVYKLVKKQNITHEMHEAIEHGEKVELKADEDYFVQMTWANCNPNIHIEEGEKQSHYFTYGSSELNSNTFKKITYKNVYAGIDFEYTIPENNDFGIKYNVIVHPGANPNDIKMVYSGDVKKIILNQSGEVIIKTPLDNITEHAPETFYQDKQSVASVFHLDKNNISFDFPKGYDNSKTLIIDPWITTITTLSDNNYGFDVDYDFAGNVFVYGGNEPFKVSMYNPAGILQWTFSGTVASPYWATGGYPGNFVVNKNSGKSYIGQGYSPSGTTIIRISNTGNYDNFITSANPNWNECWDMGFHCTTGNIYAFGGGQSGNLSAGIINQNTSSVLPTAFFPNNPLHGQDVSSHAIDYLGNVFVYFSQGEDASYLLNNKIVRLDQSLTSVVWNQPSTYFTLSECKNKAAYIGSGIMNPNSNTSNGFNCLAVNADYLYFYDGFNLAAYDKTTGSKKGFTTIVGNTPKQQGGIAVDDCNNVYVGGKGSVLSYYFNDSVFVLNSEIQLADTTTNKYVYDIRLDKANNLIYVSGSEFVGAYKVISCENINGTSTLNTLKVCKGQTLQLNTPLSPSYSWVGPNGFTSNLQNPFLLNASAAMAGNYSVITAPSFCSTTTLAITNVIIDSLKVNITANPSIGFAPLNVEFSNVTTLQNVNTSIVTSNWNFGNGLSKTYVGTSAAYLMNGLPNGNTVYQSAGSYITNLVVTQKTGTLICVGTAKATVIVEQPSQLEIPNTFTPNGDGTNDNFILSITNISGVTCQIYDRWGVKMYDVKSEKGNINWDGKNFSGKDVPAGTYFYILTAEGKDGKTVWVNEKGEEIKQNGTISLFR